MLPLGLALGIPPPKYCAGDPGEVAPTPSPTLLLFLRFMEFEAEEELQIQKMKLLNSSQFQPLPADPPKLPSPPAPDAGQQQGTSLLTPQNTRGWREPPLHR